MTPSPPAARRPLLLGCGLLATLALLLPGCGEERGGASESAASGPSQDRSQTEAKESPAPLRSTPGGCPRQLDAFVSKLRRLRRDLAVGLSYEQYTVAVKSLHASYDAIPVERLTLDCLAGSGTPAENALNKHVDAANTWGECLADASCTTATIEPVLQRKWRVASRHLSEAH